MIFFLLFFRRGEPWPARSAPAPRLLRHKEKQPRPTSTMAEEEKLTKLMGTSSSKTIQKPLVRNWAREARFPMRKMAMTDPQMNKIIKKRQKSRKKS